MAWPDCGTTTAATLPDDDASSFGPQLTAWIVYMTVVCRMPRRKVQRFSGEALQIEISVGSTQKAWEEASAAVDLPYEQLRQDLQQQPVVNGDETGHRTNAEKRWLWVMVARTTEAERFCRDALALHARLFRLWHRFRGDAPRRHARITRRQLILKSIPLEKQFFALAERHLESGDSKVRNLARALFVNFEHFFTCIEHEHVEPTNNSAERALRHAVIWRKIMFGNRSEAGEVAVARLLTIAAPCKMQNRDVLVYLTMAIRSHRRGDTPPSLLSK